jgi:gliding motility-associated-like protein
MLLKNKIIKLIAQCIIILCAISFKKLIAQSNLIPNPSFEQFSSCPTNAGQITLSAQWSSPTQFGSPDYFNQCDIINGLGVPSNGYGYQSALTGVAYSGIVLYSTILSDYREYLQTPLLNPLSFGRIYCFSFNVCLSESSRFSINQFGVYFSSISINQNISTNLPIVPSAEVYATVFYNDTTNWVNISGTYLANGGENYFLVGNFRNNSNSVFGTETGTTNNAYYYIDDVSVYYCDEDTSSVGVIPNVFTPNGDEKNETFFIPNTGLQNIDCKIYNRWGSIVYNITAPNDFWDGHTTSGEPCSNGVYYYILTATGTDGKEYLRNGYVQLVK